MCQNYAAFLACPAKTVVSLTFKAGPREIQTFVTLVAYNVMGILKNDAYY